MASFVLPALCGLILSGCSFQTYHPDELGASGFGMDGCAVTRLDGTIGSDGSVLLLKPDDLQKLRSILAGYGKAEPRILPGGSEVHLISLSSGWNSGVGTYIEAKASVANMGNKVYYFGLHEVISHSLSKKDFARFVESAFVPCKKQ